MKDKEEENHRRSVIDEFYRKIDKREKTPIGDVIVSGDGFVLSTPEEYEKTFPKKLYEFRHPPYVPGPTKNICPCSDPIQKIGRLAGNLLTELEDYKDIALGTSEIRKGNQEGKLVTAFDEIDRIEKLAKDIYVEKINYDRCCFPDRKIPKISEKDIKVRSSIAKFKETLELVRKIKD